MAVTYKDIDQLTQKSALAGTEKIPVSDTEYTTPNQIVGLGVTVYSGSGTPSSSLGKNGDLYLQV